MFRNDTQAHLKVQIHCWKELFQLVWVTSIWGAPKAAVGVPGVRPGDGFQAVTQGKVRHVLVELVIGL